MLAVTWPGILTPPPPVKIMKTIFQLVSDMNVAFGNPQGDPNKIDGRRLLNQCKNIASEFIELMQGFGIKVDIFIGEPGSYETSFPDAESQINWIRDALCDIMVFALGGHHFMGYDADEDVAEVVDALMSRICKDELHAQRTVEHYQSLGLQVYTEKTAFGIAVKSLVDQQMPEFPKGKFLKALGYRKPVFKARGEDPMARMARERETRMQEERRKRAEIDEKVMAYRQLLEHEAFGLPPYDPNQNQDTVPGGQHEKAIARSFLGQPTE